MFRIILILSFLQALRGEVQWVLSNGGQSQFDSCSSRGLVPTSSSSSIDWDLNVFLNVSSYLSRNPINAAGIFGCCAPSMWCNETVCFSQSFSASYSNYGSLAAVPDSNGIMYNNYLPVYTCETGNSSLSTVTVSTVTTSRTSGVATITGTNFGKNEAKLTTFLNSSICTFAEICSNVCSKCEGNSDCPPNAACIDVGGDSRCFPYCAGDNDQSCPCDTVCSSQIIEIDDSTPKYKVGISICTPIAQRPFSCSGSLYTSGSTTSVQCKFPITNPPANTSTSTVSYVASVEVDAAGNAAVAYGDDLATTSISFPLTALQRACDDDADCNEGNACTISTCASGGFCEDAYAFTSTFATNNSSPAAAAIDNTTVHCTTQQEQTVSRTAPYTYLSWYTFEAQQQSQQEDFYDFMLRNGTVLGSPVAAPTTGPPPSVYFGGAALALSASHQFEYFGNVISSLGVNPNGVLSLTPVADCSSTVYNVMCINYASESNTVTVFNHRWSYAHASSKVYYYLQDNTDSEDSAYFNETANAVHILYSNVTDTGGNMLATFAASIYQDGSIRLSYLDITYLNENYNIVDNITHTAGNSEDNEGYLFGLWGARASSTNFRAYLKYHQESVPAELIASGTAIHYCYLPYVIGCVSDTCITPTASAVANSEHGQLTLTLKLPEMINNYYNTSAESAVLNTCSALGDEVQLSYACIWTTGVTTPATLSYLPPVNVNVNETILPTKVLLTCNVPDLPFDDNTLTTVSIGVSLLGSVAVSGYTLLTNMEDGSHSIYTKLRRVNGDSTNPAELSNGQIMLRYYSAGSTAIESDASCGCSALSDSSNAAAPLSSYYACDDCLVCGGSNTTVDCDGNCYGSAYIDSCSQCSGGYSGVVPDASCDFQSTDSGTDGGSWNGLLVIFLLLFFIFTVAVCYFFVNTYHRTYALHTLRQRQLQQRQLQQWIMMGGGDDIDINNLDNIINQNMVFYIDEGEDGEMVLQAAPRRGGRTARNARGAGAAPAAASDGLAQSEINRIPNFNFYDVENEPTKKKQKKPKAKKAVSETPKADGIGAVESGSGSSSSDDSLLPSEKSGKDTSASAELELTNMAGTKVAITLGAEKEEDDDEDEDDSNSNRKECAVCLEHFNNGDFCRQLPAPCNHMFHEFCIDEWLRTTPTCPLCKRSVRELIGGAGCTQQPTGAPSRVAAFQPPRVVSAARNIDSETMIAPTVVTSSTRMPRASAANTNGNGNAPHHRNGNSSNSSNSAVGLLRSFGLVPGDRSTNNDNSNSNRPNDDSSEVL